MRRIVIIKGKALLYGFVDPTLKIMPKNSVSLLVNEQEFKVMKTALRKFNVMQRGLEERVIKQKELTRKRIT